MFTISVPCSSANIGPGFDVIGLALSVYLQLQFAVGEEHHEQQQRLQQLQQQGHATVNGLGTLKTSSPISTKAGKLAFASESSLNCTISYEGQGVEDVSLDPQRNLITRTALYVLKCHDINVFPPNTRLHIINPIPLGRGLGSSGTAVVAGVALANELGKLGLSRNRMLDYCLMIERHPDNVAASLYGGFVGTYLNDLNPEDMARKEIPLSEVLPQPAGGLDTGLKPPSPPFNIGHYKKFSWAKEIQCIAVIPDFEVSTATGRAVLPEKYTRADMIFNMQRLALLATALGESPPDADMIYEGMQDKVHQPYRKGLIPGLTDILHSVTPKSHPGLLGICLSGAGPTILALATHNYDNIANTLINRFKVEGIMAEWRLLRPAQDGTTVSYSSLSPSFTSVHAPTLASAPDSATAPNTSKSLTYASAGVSIDAGNLLVQRIKAAVASTARPGTDAQIGGFGGSFDLHAAGYEQAPVLIQAMDGVGTKLKIAVSTDNHSTVGVDLVAMNVNDLVVQGAEPLSFLDYFGCGRLDVAVASQFVEGVAKGCKMAGCALVGGETAEMPGFYEDGEYDVAGQATGAISRGRRLLPDKDGMVEGDVLLGLASSGPHSNGYSLIRKIVEREGLRWEEVAPWEKETGMSVGESLLTPTRIYVKACLSLVRAGVVKGMAHITGGGLTENIPRMLPDHLSANLDISTWPVPPVFRWLMRVGDLSNDEFARTWNTGLGMVIVVPRERTDEAVALLEGEGEKVFTVGELARRDKKRRRIREDDEINGDGIEKKRMKTATAAAAAASESASHSNDNVEEKRDEGCVLLNVSSWNWDKTV